MGVQCFTENFMIMAKYTITHKCGHTEEVQLFGTYAERGKRIALLEKQVCDECWKAKANAESEIAKNARGLTDLTGSEKQIRWANTIRENTYKALDCLAPYATHDRAKAMVEKWKAKMEAETTAKWWIDNRQKMPSPLSGSGDERSAMFAARKIISDFENLFKER